MLKEAGIRYFVRNHTYIPSRVARQILHNENSARPRASRICYETVARRRRANYGWLGDGQGNVESDSVTVDDWLDDVDGSV